MSDLRPPEPPKCPRCGDDQNVVPVGDAHSTLAWFRCARCNHVWATKPDTPKTPKI